MPDSSQDTLIGFNIYRESELYQFQSETLLYNTEGGGNCGDDFLVYNEGGPFWIHVTAVYNSTQEESTYIDSVYCDGFVIGIDERRSSGLKLFPNPTTGKLKINEEGIKRILVFNQTGKILLENNKNSEIDICNLSNGIYFIKVITGEGKFVEKVILE